MLKFKVTNQIIERVDSFEVVADSSNYLKASFELSEEWQGDIIAIFGFDGEYYNALLKNGDCDVPWEVIKPPFFTVSVVCGDRITADAVTVEVKKSGYPALNFSKEPTPDVYTQFLKAIKTPYIGENKNWYEWDKETGIFNDSGIRAEGLDGHTPQKGIDYFDGKDGYTPKRGTDFWTEEDKAEIKAYVNEAILGGEW